MSHRRLGHLGPDDVTPRERSPSSRDRPAPPTGTVIVHPDHGSQFRSHRYQHTQKAHGLTGFMGRVAYAGDNAAMKSFFALLQNNALGRPSLKSREDLPVAVTSWTWKAYPRRRRQRGLGRMTPIESGTTTVRHTAVAARTTNQH